MPGAHARSALAGTRFADLRWVAETASTQADVLAEAREGAAEGVVVVADHQTAGRGRSGRTWEAPPGASILLSLLLRPPAAVSGLCTAAVSLAAADAIAAVAGFRPDLKWPNDLVVEDADGFRKLAGILAEADWPTGSAISDGWREPGPTDRVPVVVGIGINVAWPDEVPAHLADVAVAINHVTGSAPDREELVVAFLLALDAVYGNLVDDGADRLRERWRDALATLGRAVRIDLGVDDVHGRAVDVTTEGHLVVETTDGERRSFAVGDVHHLR